MKNELGSRNRFLFRLIVYSLTPLVGFAVFIAERNTIEGMLIGGMGIIAGLLAQYMIFSRLKNPMNAIRYVLNPLALSHSNAQKTLAESEMEIDQESFIAQFKTNFEEAYPDILSRTELVESGEHVFVVGDEIYFIPVENDSSDLAEIIDSLIIPLKKQHFFAVRLDKEIVEQLS